MLEAMIWIVLTMIVLGFVLTLLFRNVELPAVVKQVIIAVVVFFFCVWLLSLFGLVDTSRFRL